MWPLFFVFAKKKDISFIQERVRPQIITLNAGLNTTINYTLKSCAVHARIKMTPLSASSLCSLAPSEQTLLRSSFTKTPTMILGTRTTSSSSQQSNRRRRSSSFFLPKAAHARASSSSSSSKSEQPKASSSSSRKKTKKASLPSLQAKREKKSKTLTSSSSSLPRAVALSSRSGGGGRSNSTEDECSGDDVRSSGGALEAGDDALQFGELLDATEPMVRQNDNCLLYTSPSPRDRG